MDNPQGAEAHPMRLLQIVFHNRLGFARWNSVEIENVSDRNTNGFVTYAFKIIHNCC